MYHNNSNIAFIIVNTCFDLDYLFGPTLLFGFPNSVILTRVTVPQRTAVCLSNTGAESFSLGNIANAPAASLQANRAGPSSEQPANSKQMTASTLGTRR